MFAIVEFSNNKKEFSVVPLIWLSDDKASCWWPKSIRTENQLQKIIKEQCPPKPSWGHYGIKKTHSTAGNKTTFNKYTYFFFRNVL